eukprot:maker-scaffold_101-snap-gene-0.5-mRNA-1 protein AED:0.80 eAED:0.86 QI:0/0/0/0.66/0/0/3/0/275
MSQCYLISSTPRGTQKRLIEKDSLPDDFFSGKFDSSQLVWELYPIIRTFNKLSYLLPFHPTAVQVYTDHLNLRAILQGGSKINHGHLNRLQRWKVILQHVLMDVHHVNGDILDALSIYTEKEDSLLGDEDLFFRIKRDFQEWTPDLLQPKRKKWVEEVSINITPKYFLQPSVTDSRQIVSRIIRKLLSKEDAPNLKEGVERKTRKEYSEEEWRKLTDDYATWPTEVLSDVSNTDKGNYAETDTYSTSEDEDNTTARIMNVVVRVNHLGPKRQMEK